MIYDFTSLELKVVKLDVISACISEEGDIDVILVTPPNDWLAHVINSEGVLCDKPHGVRRK